MESLVLLGLLAIAGLIAAPIAAFTALSRTTRLKGEVERLRIALESLERATSAPQRPAAEPRRDADPVPPVPEPPAKPAPPVARPVAASIQTPETAPPRPPPPQPRMALEPQMPPASAAAAPDPTPASPPSPPAPPFDWARFSARFERLVVANWLIWVGALALALGGVFLVRFAWEQGYFGPMARTIAATIAGLGMIAGSEWMRRRADPDAPGQIRYAPLATATAGAVTLYAAAYAAGPLYHLVPPLAALAGFVAASAVAIALAVLYGSFLAALGFVGGFIAPLLVGGADPEPLLVLGYALAVTAGALVLVHAFNWRRLVWIALGGAAVWTLIGMSWVDRPTGSLALAAYLLLLVLASTSLAWGAAKDSTFEALRAAIRERSPMAVNHIVIGASGFWILAAAGLIAPLLRDGPAQSIDPLLAGAVLYAAGAVYAAWRREGFALAPLLAAGTILIAANAAADAAGDPLSGGTGRFVAFAIVGAMIMGGAGWFAMRTMARKSLMAAVSAFTPLVLLFIAFSRVGDSVQAVGWGASGAALAVFNLAALEGLYRARGGLDEASGAASAYALGAFGAAIFGVAATLHGMWMTSLAALMLPAIAFVDRRFSLTALKLSASITGMIVMARILWPEFILGYAISPTPFLNELPIIYGVPILSFWGAARIFDASLPSGDHPLVQALDVAAIAASAMFLSVEVRHLVTGGDLGAGFEGLVEIGAYATAWSALALGLAARQGKAPRFWLKIAERAVFVVAMALAIVGLLMGANPLIQDAFDPAAFAGPPLANLMMPSYLTPAVMLGLYGLLRRRQGLVETGNAACYVAMALAGLYATIEVRNAFHDSLLLAREPLLLPEIGICAALWAGFAILSARRRREQTWLDPAERIALGIAGAAAVLGLGLALNPLLWAVPEADRLDGPPLLNVMTPSYLLPALAIGAYAVLRRARDWSTEAIAAGHIALGLVLLYATLEVRNFFHAALPLDGEQIVLAEDGAYTVVWTAAALILAAFRRPRTRAWFAQAERLVFAISVAFALIGLCAAANPLLDAAGEPPASGGPLLLNVMTASYLAPAAVMLAYAMLKRRQGHILTGHVAGFTALALLFLYATLEVRNFFHADLGLAGEPVTQAETYAYSITWILFAIATLIVGIARRRVSIRHAAMAVLALSVVKVFAFDMAALGGVLRALSFMGLGVALIGIALLYPRLVFRKETATAG